MSSWAGLWKKHKPITLLKEPLSKALVEFDKAEKAWDADPTRANIAALSGAAKNARRANAETLKLCNPKLHKQGMQWLRTQDALLEAALDLIAKDQKEFVAVLNELNTRKKAIVSMVKTMLTRSNVQVARKGLQGVQELNTFIDDSMGTRKLDADSGDLYEITRILSKLEVAYNDILKAYERKGAGADISGSLDDLKTHAQNLVAPAKGNKMTTQFSTQVAQVIKSAK